MMYFHMVGLTVMMNPFKATIKYIGSIELPSFIFYDAVLETGDEKISEGAKKYLDYVLNL